MPRGKTCGKGAKGKGGKGKGGSGKGKGGKGDGMDIDGGASYVGYHEYAYDYTRHFPMFAGNLGMLGNLERRNYKISQCAGAAGDCDVRGAIGVHADEPAGETSPVDSKRIKEEDWIPAKAKEKKSKAAEEINKAIHEAMRYKPVVVQNRFAAIEPPPEANTPTRSALKKIASKQSSARQVRTRFIDMEFDEFNEPLGQPCRSSCGCMGACDESGNLKWDASGNVASTQDSISLIFLATLDVSPEVLMKVKNIKAKCDIERKEAVANKMAGSETKALLVEMMGAVNHRGKAENS